MSSLVFCARPSGVMVLKVAAGTRSPTLIVMVVFLSQFVGKRERFVPAAMRSSGLARARPAGREFSEFLAKRKERSLSFQGGDDFDGVIATHQREAQARALGGGAWRQPVEIERKTPQS